MKKKIPRILRRMGMTICGILVAVALLWNPRSWKGFLLYWVLLLILVILGFASRDPERDTEYWPEDQHK